MKTIVLIGMMGTGKTSVGKVLAKISKMDFVDIDCEIEQITKKSISDIFEQFGEEYFRNIEQNTIQQKFKPENCVISLGGGAFEDPITQQFLLKNSIVIYLKASAKTLFNRLKNDTTRPILKNNTNINFIDNLLRKREPNYSKAQFVIAVDDKSVDDISQNILQEIKWKN